MQKLIFNKVWLFIAVAFSFTSCLKDEGYENGEYGAIRGTSGQEFVSIPVAVKTNTLGLESKSGNQNVELFVVSYDYVNPAPTDITVTIVANPALVTDTTVTKLPASTYSLPSSTLTIKAGERVSGKFSFTINTGTLDPLKKYGVGFSMTSVSKAGVAIPTNMKDVVYIISLKNKYDGVYRLQGYHNRTPYTFPYDTEIHLVTAGPDEVYFYWPEVKSIGHPIGVGPNSMSWYGAAIAPSIKFNTTTNLVTDVYNLTPGTVITMFTGAGSRVSKYDPATKKITVDWNYANNPLRAFFDDLTYIKARP